MLDVIPWSVLGDIGAQTIVVIVVFMILRGDLVPVRFYRTIVEQKEHWRSTANLLQETNQVQAKTIEKQAAVGDTVVRVMSAVQDASDKEGTKNE